MVLSLLRQGPDVVDTDLRKYFNTSGHTLAKRHVGKILVRARGRRRLAGARSAAVEALARAQHNEAVEGGRRCQA